MVGKYQGVAGDVQVGGVSGSERLGGKFRMGLSMLVEDLVTARERETKTTPESDFKVDDVLGL
jgi:hypothetical protein